MSCTNTTPKVCFNTECRDSKPQKWRKGWRLRYYDFANLCDRCGSIYEDGRFCETFHKYASGWRSCETCGKRVHCGCIVSIQAFVVLDAGGIECAICSRKNAIRTYNSTWPPRPLTGTLADGFIGNWNQAAGPCSWSRPQAVNLYDRSVGCSDLTSRVSFEADASAGSKRLFSNDWSAIFPSERSGIQNLHFNNGGLKHNGSHILDYGKRVFNHEKEPHSCRKDPVHQSITFCPPLGSQTDNQRRVSDWHPRQHCLPDVMRNKLGSSPDGIDSSHQPHTCNSKHADMAPWKEFLPHCWPKIPDEPLQHITGTSNPVITPLFEKTLSASDTGRIGRLVLPKKCAEIYFPAISQPEGLPLRVQDVKGKEWIFQFRFWPNNNSRMYVLEGITNCIQSLQLQAGDVVTFSRVEPEGKLIMGFRKSSTGPQTDQSTQATRAIKETCSNGDVGNRKSDDENFTSCLLKCHQISECYSSRGQLNTVSAPTALSDDGRLGDAAKEAVGTSSSIIPCKRKNGVLCSKRKCLKVDNVDLLELVVTLEEAQGLFRSPADCAANAVIIEDILFEEYEDAPVIGRPTVIAKGSMGEDIQWAQCDNCLKWRKLPSDFLLPARWTCSQNSWDPKRSSCDAVQELTSGQLQDVLSIDSPAAWGQLQDVELGFQTSGAMDAFADYTTEGAGKARPALTRLTSKHPRHKPGCSCIVCNQPSSGRGHNHYHNHTHDACPMAKQEQQPQTIMLHQGVNHLGKGAAIQKPNFQDGTQTPEKLGPRIGLVDNGRPGYVNATERVICTPVKGQIDLNIQPDREEEALTLCELTKTIKMAPDAGKVNPKGFDKYKLVFEVSSGGNSGAVNR